MLLSTDAYQKWDKERTTGKTLCVHEIGERIYTVNSSKIPNYLKRKDRGVPDLSHSLQASPPPCPTVLSNERDLGRVMGPFSQAGGDQAQPTFQFPVFGEKRDGNKERINQIDKDLRMSRSQKSSPASLSPHSSYKCIPIAAKDPDLHPPGSIRHLPRDAFAVSSS